MLFGPATGFEVMEAEMSAPARIYPAANWRADPFLELPLHDGMAAAYILARKVADLTPGSVRWPDSRQGLAQINQQYPRHAS